MDERLRLYAQLGIADPAAAVAEADRFALDERLSRIERRLDATAHDLRVLSFVVVIAVLLFAFLS